MELDYILNGQPVGDVASRLMDNNCNPACLRPWRGENEKSYISIMNSQGVLEARQVANATSTLRKDDWVVLDDAIVKAAQPRLKAVADLRAAGLTFTIANGMGKTVLETETMSDLDPAIVSMDGMRESPNDRPEFNLGSLPLPIIHKDFSYSLRQVMASRNGGSPLDTTTAEAAARKVAESAEQMLLGIHPTADQYAYGGGTIYGYTDFPSALTRTITTPTGAATDGANALADLLAMRSQAQAAYHFGPYMLYVSPSWDQFLDNDFKAASDKSIRQRLNEVSNITGIRTLDYLTNFDWILVQMTSDVVREVIGMDITTVQWETKGGMRLNFKVMAIMVPQLRADFNSRTGIVYGAV